jgi:hypothetical protein
MNEMAEQAVGAEQRSSGTTLTNTEVVGQQLKMTGRERLANGVSSDVHQQSLLSDADRPSISLYVGVPHRRNPSLPPVTKRESETTQAKSEQASPSAINSIPHNTSILSSSQEDPRNNEMVDSDGVVPSDSANDPAPDANIEADRTIAPTPIDPLLDEDHDDLLIRTDWIEEPIPVKNLKIAGYLEPVGVSDAPTAPKEKRERDLQICQDRQNNLISSRLIPLSKFDWAILYSYILQLTISLLLCASLFIFTRYRFHD